MSTKLVKVYTRMPQGWRRLERATTAPRGTVWVSNGQPLFRKNKYGDWYCNKNYEQGLLVVDKAQYAEHLKRKAQ